MANGRNGRDLNLSNGRLIWTDPDTGHKVTFILGEDITEDRTIVITNNNVTLGAGVIPGPPGQQGAPGIPGTNGTNGTNGVSVGQATVTPQGQLILILTDGTQINAGIVKGPKGDTGSQGLQGEKGDKGDPGADGHGVPSTSGSNGDVLIKDTTTADGTRWGAAPQTGIPNVQADPAPKLGANLDANGKNISNARLLLANVLVAAPEGDFDVLQPNSGAPGARITINTGVGTKAFSLPAAAPAQGQTVQADAQGNLNFVAFPQGFSGAYADLTGKPTLFSGSYNDLTNKPTLFSGAYADLTGKPTFATVATSGSAADLTGLLALARITPSATNGYILTTSGGAVTWAAAPAGGVTSVAGRTGAVTLTKSDVGLANVDNTSDANKPISSATQTALNAKEPTITAGTTSQYYRGDKTFVTLDKASVGLGNVDNTSDANKPISSATQTALNAKQNTITANSLAVNSLVAGTNGQVLTVNSSGVVVWGAASSGGITKVQDDTAPKLGGSLDGNAKSISNVNNFTFNNLVAGPSAFLDKIGGNTTGGRVSIADVNGNILFGLPNASGSAGQVLYRVSGTNTGWVSLTASDISGLSTVASTGSYNDLLNKPTLFSGAYADLTGKPVLATVATSGSYNDLLNKPTLVTNLDSLTDVVITSPATNQILKFDGTNWVNGTAPSSGLTSVSQDTAPKLGGDLVSNGFDIRSNGGGLFLKSFDTSATPIQKTAIGGNASGIAYIGGSLATRIVSLNPTTGSFTSLFDLPTTPGSEGQVLTRAASGATTWTTPSSGGSGITSVQQDTAPKLGGDLDVNGYKIKKGTADALLFTTAGSLVDVKVPGTLTVFNAIQTASGSNYISMYDTSSTDIVANQAINLYPGQGDATQANLVIQNNGGLYAGGGQINLDPYNNVFYIGNLQSIGFQSGGSFDGDVLAAGTGDLTLLSVGTTSRVKIQKNGTVLYGLPNTAGDPGQVITKDATGSGSSWTTPSGGGGGSNALTYYNMGFV